MVSRSRADSPSAQASEPASPHERQARRRLIGAAALALAVGVLFSLFFDAEPRGVRDDVQVRIPAREAAGSGQAQPPAAPTQAARVADASPVDGPAAGAVSRAPAQASSGTESRDEAATEPPPAGVAVAEPAPPPIAPLAGATVPKADAAKVDTAKADTAKADSVARPSVKAIGGEAKPEAKPGAKPEAKAGGYYLQVGAFASEKAATDQVERIKRLGATAFKESIRTQQGERIRVRLGPYPTREAADPVRNRLRAAGIDVTLVAP